MNSRPVPFIKPIMALAALGLLVLGAGCDDSTAPGEVVDDALNTPDVTVREPARAARTDAAVELTLELSAGLAHPGEAVQFDAYAANLLDEPLEFYGLVCWPDSPRFFLIDGAGAVYRVEWQPVPPCPSSIKHLPVGETAASRDWFSGRALRDGAAVELPFGDYTARAVYAYRPLSAPGAERTEISVEAPFRWEALPE